MRHFKPMNNDNFLEAKDIVVIVGNVEFKDYEQIKKQAIRLAAEIEQVEVSEENIKESKKLLAVVNKQLKELEDRRIAIKKVILEPYQLFEDQVKEIVGIVKTADELVRKQVNYLEEFERLQKEEVLQNLFEKRMVHYSFRNLFGFKDFLKPKHLNKTGSVKAIEDEMIEFLEKLTRDMKAIEQMGNAEAVLSAYMESKDLGAALTLIGEQERRRNQIQASQAMKNQAPIKIFLLAVYDEKDLKLVEMFMEQNNIKFTVEDGL